MAANSGMKWASASSDNPKTDGALERIFEKLHDDLQGARPDMAFVFASPHHTANYARIGTTIDGALKPEHLLGCSGGGIIGGGLELEDKPALSVTAALLPGVEIKTFHLQDGDLPGPDDGPKRWEQAIGVQAADEPNFVLLADPYSMMRCEDMLRGMDFAFPKAVKLGGLASGASGPAQNALYRDREFQRAGTVGVAFSGALAVDTLVAQGCRPIGAPMKITRCQRNILVELDKKPALLAVQELFESSTDADRELMQSSLFLGIVMDPFKEGAPKPGDFLIRNLIGMDNERGVLAVGAMLDVGQTVQFHLREAAAATLDLESVLRRYSTERLNAAKGESLPIPPRGALLFSCLGRGAHLYGKPNQDSEAFRSEFGDIPLGGFFCNGEIGPVGGTTYIHGFTSSFGIFRDKL